MSVVKSRMASRLIRSIECTRWRSVNLDESGIHATGDFPDAKFSRGLNQHADGRIAALEDQDLQDINAMLLNGPGDQGVDKRTVRIPNAREIQRDFLAEINVGVDS